MFFSDVGYDKIYTVGFDGSNKTTFVDTARPYGIVFDDFMR